jgi:hypothetical protein
MDASGSAKVDSAGVLCGQLKQKVECKRHLFHNAAHLSKHTPEK